MPGIHDSLSEQAAEGSHMQQPQSCRQRRQGTHQAAHALQAVPP